MHNPFAAAIELMRRDAIFAEEMWQLYMLDAQAMANPGAAVELSLLADKLGARLSEAFGFDTYEVAMWLSYNIESVIRYYGAFYPYGSFIHKTSALGFLFRSIRNRTSLSRFELETALITGINLFVVILWPFLFLLGVMQYKSIFTWVDRTLFMFVAFAFVVTAKIAGTYVTNARALLASEEMHRHLGFRLLQRFEPHSSPLRLRLSCQVFESIGEGAIFYAVGTFLNETYSTWQLIIAIMTGILVLYEILRYVLKGA